MLSTVSSCLQKYLCAVKEENVIYIQEKGNGNSQPRFKYSKDFQAAILNMFKELKENIV